MTLKEYEKAIGMGCCVKMIDMEECLYVDFGNGYNVEISGYRNQKSKAPFTLFLWYGERFGDCYCTDMFPDVCRKPDELRKAVLKAKEKADQYVSMGLTTRDAIVSHLYKHPQ